MRISLNTPQDYLAMAVRRRWWILVPFVALMGVATLTIMILPKTYVSEALVLVRPSEIPEDMVRSLVSGSTSRLALIESTLRSRRNLTQVLAEFADEMPEMEGLSTDQRVARLNNQIEFEFQFEQTRSETVLSSFRLRYQNSNPELAQRIALTLTDMFIREDNEVRAEQTNASIDFLQDQVDDIERDLRAADEERRTLLSENQLTLPEQQAAILSELDRMTQQRLSLAEQLDRANLRRIEVEQTLAETPETIPEEGYRILGTPAPPVDPRIEQYRQARRAFEEAKGRFTEINPNYRTAERRLRALESELPLEVLAAAESDTGPESDTTVAPQAAAGSSMVPNPVYVNLSEMLGELRGDISVAEAERARIREREVALEGRLAGIPRTGLLIADVNRRHQVLQSQYDTAQNMLREAQVSGDLETEQRGAMFDVVDSANLPLEPSKPNKAVLLLAGLIGSLAVSVALAAGVDIARQRVWTQAEVEQLWGVPVLVDIPEIVTDQDIAVQKRRNLRWGVSSFAATLAYGFVLYAFYLQHEPILQVLDPVLQRIVYR